MGAPTPVILRVATPEYGRVVIEASDRFRYHADLSSFRAVGCYPGSAAEWNRVSPDSYGLALVWSSRLEVHVDQIIGLADQREAIERTAWAGSRGERLVRPARSEPTRAPAAPGG